MLTTKVINIGDWDMQTNSNKTVAHGVPDFTTIRSISVVIRNDNNTYHYDLTRAGIIARWTTTNIDLLRDLGGTFDNVDFNATSYNRGFVTITYEVTVPTGIESVSDKKVLQTNYINYLGQPTNECRPCIEELIFDDGSRQRKQVSYK